MIRMGALKARKIPPARIYEQEEKGERTPVTYSNLRQFQKGVKRRRRAQFLAETVPAMPNMDSLLSLTHFVNTACTGLVGYRKIPAAQVRNTAHIRNLSTVLASDGSAAEAAGAGAEDEPLAPAAALPTPVCRCCRSGSRSWAMARRRESGRARENLGGKARTSLCVLWG